MILYDICFLLAEFCYIIIYVWKFESHVQSVNRCGLGIFLAVRRTLFCRRCNFSRWLSAANSQLGQACVIILLMNASSRVTLMLVLTRSLLNREYILANVLKALAWIIYMCNLHVAFLLKITLRYFILFASGMFHPFSEIWDSGSWWLRKLNPLSFIFINFNSPALTPDLHWAEIMLGFSDNKTIL
jgi:hypothetical protein